MSELKNIMISQAVEMYREIYPCTTKQKLGECFTTEGTMLMFWFNTTDESTHVLASQIG